MKPLPEWRGFCIVYSLFTIITINYDSITSKQVTGGDSLKAKIEAMKQTDLFKSWDGERKPEKDLISYVYDFFYDGNKSPTPDAETREDIIEFLHIIKEEII